MTAIQTLEKKVKRLEDVIRRLTASDAIRPVLADPAAVPIGAGDVTEIYLADGSVSTLKIGSQAVTGIKIADLAVTAAKMADATITNAKIADATIQSAKIANLSADKIIAGSGIITNLSVLATLTLGVGGKIQDNDGSYWDKDGLVLKTLDAIQDSITINRDTFNGNIKWQSFIDTNLNRTVLRTNWNDNSINTRDAAFRGEATNDDGTTYAGVETVSTAGLTNAVYAYADGIIQMGVQYSVGGVARLGLFRTPTFGNGEGVIYIGNRATAPTANPTSGGLLYCESGALRYRGSSGTTTTLANA
jgi:hypothetical protein